MGLLQKNQSGAGGRGQTLRKGKEGDRSRDAWVRSGFGSGMAVREQERQDRPRDRLRGCVSWCQKAEKSRGAKGREFLSTRGKLPEGFRRLRGLGPLAVPRAGWRCL